MDKPPIDFERLKAIKDPVKFYKVLVGSQSCHGGKYTWDLPSESSGLYTPSIWNTYVAKLELCSKGLHVTTNPSLWWKDGCTVYEVKVEGECGGKDEKKSKFVYPRVQLLRPVKMINIDGGWKIEQDEKKSSGWSEPFKE